MKSQNSKKMKFTSYDWGNGLLGMAVGIGIGFTKYEKINAVLLILFGVLGIYLVLRGNKDE